MKRRKKEYSGKDNVILLAKNPPFLNATYDKIRRESLPEPFLAQMNLSQADPDDYAHLVQQIEKNSGRLDSLVLNGAELVQLTPLEYYPIEKWYSIMQTNLNSAFYGAYGVSKAGLKQLMLSLAFELEHSPITVFGIVPASCDTSLRKTVYPANEKKEVNPEVLLPAYRYLLGQRKSAHGKLLSAEKFLRENAFNQGCVA